MKSNDSKASGLNWSLDDFIVPQEEGKTRFHDLDLPDQVMQGIQRLGFESPSPIQAETIPVALSGKDIVGLSQTGSGKTAAFGLPALNMIDIDRKETQVLVLCPTRELAVQVCEEINRLASCLRGFTSIPVYFEAQQKQLQKRHTDIMVATPGRLLDFCRRGHVNLREVEVVVLDEADRMLSMGFIPDVRAILRQTPKKEDRQTLLFSATFSEQILRLAEQWTFEPVHVEIESDDLASATVEQRFFSVARADKYKVLLNCLKTMGVERAIVFANRRHITRDLAEKLQKDGIKSALLSGEVAQVKRVKTLERFRSGDTPILVATDVAGRGIHVDGVSHVFNYDLPEELEDYVHRIGRTGRAGATGISISFASEDDAFIIPDLEEMLGKRLDCEPTPSELLV